MISGELLEYEDKLIISAYPDEDSDKPVLYNIEATQYDILVDYVPGVEEKNIKAVIEQMRADWLEMLKNNPEGSASEEKYSRS